MREHADAEEDRATELTPPVRPTAPWRVTSLEVLSGFRLHVRFNDGTEGTVELAGFLNSASAGIFAALRDERLAGAALDCFAQEPVARPHRFGEFENVLLAPHSIAWTDELFRDIGQTVCRGLLALSRGERPHGVVNPEVFERPGFQQKWARLLEGGPK